MIQFQKLLTAVLVFCFVFANRMDSLQQTIGVSHLQRNGDMEKTNLEQTLLNSMQNTFLSLVSSKTRKLEDKYNMLLRESGTCDDIRVEIQNLTTRINQFQEIENAMMNVISKIDKIEEKVANVTRDNNCVGEQWITYNGMKYYFSDEAVPWEKARTNCQNRGSHLVSILSASVNSFLIRNGKNGQYWTGGTDKAREGRWVWDYQKVRASYTNWRPGEPNNAGYEHCLVLFTDPSKTRHWNDAGCELYVRYICQTTDN